MSSPANPQLDGSVPSSAGIVSVSGAVPQISIPSLGDLKTSEPGSQTQLLETVSSSSAEPAQSPPKPSWADMLKGPSKNMEKKGAPFVLETGELCVQIPNEVITRNHKRWESFIIGQFHGNLPSPGALHAILNGIWSNRLRDITISKLATRTVLIRIPNSITRQRVLNQGIWHIEGQTMFVAAWEPGLKPTMPELTEAPVWLEFRGVPPHFFSEEGFEHIAGMLGHPVYCHPSTINMTNLEVGKVLTIINPSVPLPEAVNIQFATGEIHRIAVSSPWLPPICSHCQEVGHSIRRCPTAPITCLGCNSSSHNEESCPRAKKPQKESGEGEKPDSTIHRKKKKKAALKWIEKISKSVKGKEVATEVMPAKSSIVAEEGSTPKHSTRTNSKFKRGTIATKAKNKTTMVSDSSVSSDSPSSSDHQEASSSESDSSEEELSSEEEIPFTKVISKKERRYLRNSSGKNSLSNKL